jgi:DNA invertase Pin-like site-specific DNA recombinase
MVIVDWFYDKAVRGADVITERPGFVAMLDRIAGNGVRTIIVESPDRFARDLAVQLAGHDHLRKLGGRVHAQRLLSVITISRIRDHHRLGRLITILSR